MRPLTLLALISLAGCAQGTDRYPSLLPRPIETQSLSEPDVPTPVATADAALDRQLAEITASLQAANARFTSAARDAEAKIAVARGVPEGSEAWLDAQMALSTLDVLRAPISTIAADLEALAIERGRLGQPAYPAIDAAIAEAAAATKAQGARVTSLEAALSGR
ncbi:hypothetical protein [Sphingomonas sp. M1-B02]|uniref:hypothetical protein n=1 Tax=Sphingomonas sp. M1-B02 TaxID=3114300 RepID=UPI00223EDEB4|nr:hypothetical protein [Sphingomonas sp. S6-11]UZK66862.1 hypothetical protein OKW87_03225 [Sphingomonas sp. S6-11]